MRKISQDKNKIVIEFDLLDFASLQDFFKEESEAVENTGKFEYEAIQNFLKIKMDDSTDVNDMRLKKIDFMLKENEKLLK